MTGLHWYDLSTDPPSYQGNHPTGLFGMTEGLVPFADGLLATRGGGYVRFNFEESGEFTELPIQRGPEINLVGQPTIFENYLNVADRVHGTVSIVDLLEPPMNHDPPPYPHILSATQPLSHFNRPASLRPRNPGATMKRLAWFAVCFMSVVSASAAEFYVSPDGSDENPASVTAPVKSLEKARDLARLARKTKPDGTYPDFTPSGQRLPARVSNRFRWTRSASTKTTPALPSPSRKAEGVREHPEWLRSVPIGD